MACVSALTRARYADAELPASEMSAVANHLTGCSTCRLSVAALQAESQQLRLALRIGEGCDTIPDFAPSPSIPTPLAVLGWGTLLVWAVNLGWTQLTSSTALPTGLTWLTPDSAALAARFAIELLTYLAAQGGALVASAVESAGYLSAAGVVVTATWLLLRRLPRHTTSLCAVVCIAISVGASAPAAYALEILRDDHRVTVSAGETVDDTLIVFSESILIEGNVTGDLIAFGEQVRILGEIGGNVIVAAEEVNITGRVSGTVLSAGETLDFHDAQLMANLFAAGQTINVSQSTRAAGNIVVAGQDIEIHGSAGKDLLGAAQHLSLFGEVEGDFRATGAQIDLGSNARVGGDVNVRVKTADNMQIASGASIGGASNIDVEPEEESQYVKFDFYLGTTLKFVAAFVAGLILFWLFPALRYAQIDGGTEGVKIAGIGAAVLIATPVLALVATITLIGAPIGIATFLLWLIAMYGAAIVAANYLGRQLLAQETHDGALPLLAGLVILYVLGNVPFLGGPVRLVALVVGLGLIARWLHGVWTNRHGGLAA